MATKSLTLQIRPRGKPIPKLPETLELGANATGAELFSLLSSRTQRSVHRLKVTRGSDGTTVYNDPRNSLHSLGIREQSVIHVKDLGMQVQWQTVFIIEYIGPLIIQPVVYVLRPYIYPNAPRQPSQLQKITFWLIMLHFIKRELETLFVHRFSAATMLIFNIFLNSAHYWGLSGLIMALWVNAPFSRTAGPANPMLLYPGLVLYIVGQAGSFQSHMTLRSLRTQGGRERGIPRGTFFNMVTCPNYFFEILVWLGVYLVTGFSWSVVFFMTAAFVTMGIWGKKKERRYRKEFGDKYKRKRYVMFPGIY